MEREREIIKLTEHESAPLVYEYILEDGEYGQHYDSEGNENEDPIWDFWHNFETVSSKITDYDLEDCCVNIETILQRISDGKYFMAEWVEYYSEYDFPTELVEVFPTQETITVYV